MLGHVIKALTDKTVAMFQSWPWLQKNTNIKGEWLRYNHERALGSWKGGTPLDAWSLCWPMRPHDDKVLQNPAVWMHVLILLLVHIQANMHMFLMWFILAVYYKKMRNACGESCLATCLVWMVRGRYQQTSHCTICPMPNIQKKRFRMSAYRTKQLKNII